MMRPSPAAGERGASRPFLPPPIESLALDGGEDTQRRLELRRSYESGYQAGVAEGHAEGHAEGQREARAEAARQAAEGVQAAALRTQSEGIVVLNAAMADLGARQSDALAAQERDLRTALAAAIRHLAPRLATAAMPSELAALVGEAMARRGGSLVTLRAHPETLAHLPAEERPDGLGLLPDPTMRKDTAEANWSAGGLVFDAEALAERVLAVLVPVSDAAFLPPEENPV